MKWTLGGWLFIVVNFDKKKKTKWLDRKTMWNWKRFIKSHCQRQNIYKYFIQCLLLQVSLLQLGWEHHPRSLTRSCHWFLASNDASEFVSCWPCCHFLRKLESMILSIEERMSLMSRISDKASLPLKQTKYWLFGRHAQGSTSLLVPQALQPKCHSNPLCLLQAIHIVFVSYGPKAVNTRSSWRQ